MAHSFVGIVTRQEKDSGVTLKARVTSPKGNVSKYQNFKCRIMKAGLTDDQAIYAALREIIDALEARGDLDNLNSSITSLSTKKGPYNTTVGYDIIDDSLTNRISDYFNRSGAFIGKPAYGKDRVFGKIKITVTSGSKSIDGYVAISISPYELSDLATQVNQFLTWDKIKGQNTSENIITETLDLIPSISVANMRNMVDSDVTIEWTITDQYKALDSELAEDRINNINNKGVLSTAMSYSYYNDAIQSNAQIAALCEKIKIGDNSSSNIFHIKVGGISLKATVKTGNTTIANVNFDNLSTLSNVLTNIEVSSYLSSPQVETFRRNVFKAIINDTIDCNPSLAIKLSEIATGYNIFYDATNGSVVKFKLNSVTLSRDTASNSLINQGIDLYVDSNRGIYIYDITNIVDDNTVLSSLRDIKDVTTFSTGFTIDGEYTVLSFTKNDNPAITDILVKIPYQIREYSGVGYSEINIYFKFHLEPTPAPTPSSGS